MLQYKNEIESKLNGYNYHGTIQKVLLKYNNVRTFINDCIEDAVNLRSLADQGMKGKVYICVYPTCTALYYDLDMENKINLESNRATFFKDGGFIVEIEFINNAMEVKLYTHDELKEKFNGQH